MTTIKAYKLKELSNLEKKHYMTILKSKQNYIAIEISRGKGKPLTRYLDKETSEMIKNIT